MTKKVSPLPLKTASLFLGELQSFEQRNLKVYLSRENEKEFYPLVSVDIKEDGCILNGGAPINSEEVDTSKAVDVIDIEEATTLVARCEGEAYVYLSFGVSFPTYNIGIITKSFIEQHPFVRIYTPETAN